MEALVRSMGPDHPAQPVLVFSNDPEAGGLAKARKMGVPTTVFVEITLSGQADEVLDAFERSVARIPDVLECHLMAGSADYLLKVVAEDTEDFARIHRQYLARLPGVQGMQSSFALRTVCKTTALPV